MAIDGRLHYSGARMNWTTMPGPRPLRSRGQVAHAATRGHSEARWHGDGQAAGYRACGRDKPNVGLPPYCGRVSGRSEGFSTVPSAPPIAMIRCAVRCRTAPTRWAISITSCCKAATRALAFPMAHQVNSASWPRCPRGRAAHAATRGSNGFRWYQPTRARAKPAVARLWPDNRLIAYLARSAALPR
jgi:hypothetical protein